MDLPLTPTFFRKIDIFQNLLDLEKEAKEKPIWYAEKEILLWAAGKNHQNLGEFIEGKTLINYFWPKVTSQSLTPEAVPFLSTEYEINKTFRSLEVRGLVEKSMIFTEHYRINNSGLLAGQILRETNNLRSKRKMFKYNATISIWWVLVSSTSLLVFLQLLNWIKNIIISVSLKTSG